MSKQIINFGGFLKAQRYTSHYWRLFSEEQQPKIFKLDSRMIHLFSTENPFCSYHQNKHNHYQQSPILSDLRIHAIQLLQF